MEKNNRLPLVHPGEIIRDDMFGGSPEVWMRLQAAYDLKKAARNKKVMQRVARIVPVKPQETVGA